MEDTDRCEEVATDIRFAQRCELPKGHTETRCIVSLAGLGIYAWN